MDTPAFLSNFGNNGSTSNICRSSESQRRFAPETLISPPEPPDHPNRMAAIFMPKMYGISNAVDDQ